MLLHALSPERPAEMAGDLLDAIMSEFVERIKDATGNEHVLDGMGADDAMELAGMVVDVVKAQDERVGPAVLSVWQKLEGEVHEYCDAKRLSNGAHFAKMLVRSSGADMAPEIMSKQGFLALVEEDVEEVLDECGIADENARSTVKQQMLERGNADFAAATGLKSLSDSLAAIKAAARDAALPFAPKPPPPVVPEPPHGVPGAVPDIPRIVSAGKKIPKITNEEELMDFIRSLTLDAKFGNLHEGEKEPDALGKERQTYTYRGIVFRSERRKFHELYDVNTMKEGFTSQNDLSVEKHRTEAMGLGVKGKNEKGEDILCGSGATGKSGVSCLWKATLRC